MVFRELVFSLRGYTSFSWLYRVVPLEAALREFSYNYNRGNSKGSLNGKTGQLTNIVNNLDRNKDRVYEFDSLGRLATAKGGAATGVVGPTANWTQNYGYDRYGNRPTVTASGVTADGQAVPTDGWGSMGYESQTNRFSAATGFLRDAIRDCNRAHPNATNKVTGLYSPFLSGNIAKAIN